jgi:hypothetical protein
MLKNSRQSKVAPIQSHLKAGLAAGEKAVAEAHKAATQKAVFILAARVVVGGDDLALRYGTDKFYKTQTLVYYARHHPVDAAGATGNRNTYVACPPWPPLMV